MKLWNFHGGLPLDGQKQLSTDRPLRPARLPRQLIFPLLQRDGHYAEPVVNPGERVLKGQVIARDPADRQPPIHASSSGTVAGLVNRPVPHPSGLADLCLVIDTDGQDAAISTRGLPNWREASPEDLRRIIHDAGIVGLGGAGFPTAHKLTASGIDTLILNGAECEPYITCDDSLLRHHAAEVVAGAAILRRMLGADRCLIAIEHDMPEALAAVAEALRTQDDEAIALIPVPALYPTGGERQLIRVLTGREVPSRGLPADIGVVCQNVGTAAAIHAAVIHGQPLTSRIVTITGRGISQPRNLWARIGTPMADLVAACGGYTAKAERLILGGPMMGFALPGDDIPITKATNCILVAGKGEFVAEKNTLPCIRCGACAEVCPAQLLPQQLHWYSRAGQLDRAEDYRLFDCIECGCCDVVCPSHIPLVQAFRASKGLIQAQQRERAQADHARERFLARQSRKEQEQRERAEAAQRKKAKLGKAAAPEIRDAIARAKQKRAEKIAPPPPDTPED